ncbi:MAG: M23 family metallopeptidase [Endozoicomonas sp.]
MTLSRTGFHPFTLASVQRIALAWLLVLFSTYLSGDGLPHIQSQLTQGGFFIGQVEPGSSVVFNDREVRVSSEGRFVIGFGRDARLKQQYSVTSPSAKVLKHSLTLEKRQYKVQRINGVAGKYVKPAEAVLKRIQLENLEVRSARQFDTKALDFFRGFSRPAKGPVSGVYGSQRYFNGEPRRPHFGLDIAGPVGTQVVAPADGIVRLAESDLYFSGGTIIIDHGFGLSTSYLHLSKLEVAEGDRVSRGGVIGRMGATGRVTGPHLDWRLNWFDQRLDPALMLVEEL